MTLDRRGRERAILFFTCAGHALTHVYIHYFTAIIDPMRESFGLTLEDFTAYATISTVLFGVGALPAGWLGDRFGEKKLLVMFFVVTALGGAVLGLASSTWQLVAGMVLVGLGTSIFHPVGIAMIANGISRPGKAMGINGLFGSLGTAASPFFASQLTVLFDWHAAYLVLTLPTFLLGLGLACTKLDGLRSGEAAPAGRAEKTTPERNARFRTVVTLLLAMTCVGLIFYLVITVLPSHLGERCSLARQPSLQIGGSLTGLLYLIGGLGQLLAGMLVHSREGRGLYVFFLVILAPLLYLVGILHGVPLIVVGGLMTIVMAALQPIENTLLSRYSIPSMRGVIFGLKFVLVFGIGGLGTAVSGYVIEHHGMAAVFTLGAVVTILAVVFAVAAYRLRVVPDGAGDSPRPAQR